MTTHTAFIGPFGLSEVVLVLFIGLLLFGRDLPKVGWKVGRVVADLKRSLQGFRNELDKDADFRAAREAFQDARRDFSDTKRAMNPRRLLDDVEAEQRRETREIRELVDGAGDTSGAKAADKGPLADSSGSGPGGDATRS